VHYSSPDGRTAVSVDLCSTNTQSAFIAAVTNAQANYLNYLGVSDIDRWGEHVDFSTNYLFFQRHQSGSYECVEHGL
jgi:hypothetical protein